MVVSKLAVSRLTRRTRLVAIAAPLIVAGLALAGCTPAGEATGGDASQAPAGDSAAGVNIVVIGGASDDIFFSTVKRGVDDAAKVVEANGGKVTYLALQNYNNLGPDVAQLIKNAAGQNPSAIVVPNWVPEAEDPALKEVIDSGVPVVIYNAGGVESADNLGALTYIGSDDYLAGVAAGEALGEAGVKKNLCVNTVPGAQNLENRCAGVADGIGKSGGTSEQLALPASSFGNQTAVSQAIKAAIQQDSAVDAIVTAGGSDVAAAVDALNQAGVAGDLDYIAFDLNATTLDAVKSGTATAAVDQQPYAQGYYAVSAAFQHTAWGIDLPSRPILTGPALVTADNVDKAISGTDAGVR